MRLDVPKVWTKAWYFIFLFSSSSLPLSPSPLHLPTPSPPPSFPFLLSLPFTLPPLPLTRGAPVEHRGCVPVVWGAGAGRVSREHPHPWDHWQGAAGPSPVRPDGEWVPEFGLVPEFSLIPASSIDHLQYANTERIDTWGVVPTKNLKALVLSPQGLEARALTRQHQYCLSFMVPVTIRHETGVITVRCCPLCVYHLSSPGVTESPRPPPSVVAYCKQSNTGGRNGLGI